MYHGFAIFASKKNEKNGRRNTLLATADGRNAQGGGNPDWEYYEYYEYKEGNMAAREPWAAEFPGIMAGRKPNPGTYKSYRAHFSASHPSSLK